MEQFKIDVTNGQPLLFTGEVVRAIETPAVGNNNGESRHELTLFRTEAGGWVFEVSYVTTYRNDLSLTRAWLVDEPSQVISLLNAYDAAQDKTGWPHGAEMDARRAQVEVRLRRNFAGAANQLAASLPGTCLESVRQSWRCDACGAAIEHSGEGCVEWSGGRVRVIHERCMTAESLSEPLAECLGPDGLLCLLALAEEDGIDRSGVYEVIRRLHVPLYERALPYFSKVEVARMVDFEMAPGRYRHDLLAEIVQRFEVHDHS